MGPNPTRPVGKTLGNRVFGAEKTEELRLDQLAGRLNSLFDKKISGFSSKAENLTRDLVTAKVRFGDACKKFNTLDVEPEKENIYVDNTSVLKEQKNSYSRAVIRITSEWETEIPDAPNIYYKYDTVLFGTEKFMNEVFRANATFKRVLYSYSNYLDDFKRSFSRLEKTRDALKYELHKVEREFSEFKTLNDQISELRNSSERYSLIEKTLSSSGSGPAGDPGSSNTNELGDRISAVDGDLSKTEREISDISGKVQRLCLPLERPARKLDHAAQNKRHLYPYIIDPLNTIKTEFNYNEFKALLAELGKSIDPGQIGERESAKIKDNILALTDFDLYGAITKINSLKSRKSELSFEAQMLRIRLKSQEESANASKRLMEDRESLKKEASAMKSKADNLRHSVQNLFFEYYKKRIVFVE